MLLKKPKTLNYPILFWNIAKFFQIVFRYLKHLDRLLVSGLLNSRIMEVLGLLVETLELFGLSVGSLKTFSTCHCKIEVVASVGIYLFIK
jgi:hypothetical protein